MMFPRAVFALLSLIALASAVPIDEKLQSVIAQKNNLGLINPPTVNANGSGRVVALSGAGVVLTAGVIAVLV